MPEIPVPAVPGVGPSLGVMIMAALLAFAVINHSAALINAIGPSV